MAHIALVTGLLVGRIHSTFELAARLVREGHTVTFLCQPSTRQRIEANGFSCFNLPEITFSYTDPRRAAFESSWWRKLQFHLKYRASHYVKGKKILRLEEHKKVLREVGPDLILVDVEIHDIIFTAYELKIPLKLSTTWFSDTISSKSPPLRTGVVPKLGWQGSRWGVLWTWFVMRAKINARVWVKRLTFENYRRWVFKKYAMELGFDVSGMLVNTLPPLYSFTKLPIVSMNMAELEFPHDMAKNIIYVGSMVNVSRNDATEYTSNMGELQNLLDTKTDKGKKLIYCSVGSLAQGHKPFLERVIKAVANEEQWTLILSIGPKMSLADFTWVPPNVHLFNWVPQLKVIEKSDCCITHCGMNSINECIHFKVPMLLYSGGYTDEDGNAARMTYHGLGIRGNIRKDGVETIKENLSEVLYNDKYLEQVSYYNALYRNYRERKLSPALLI